uniref:C2H2-type domain-containing protein n=1 Tax=Panagrolaimus sp. PS1159 TaxID=55785 RepID=A0AC35ES53_9BILA
MGKQKTIKPSTSVSAKEERRTKNNLEQQIEPVEVLLEETAVNGKPKNKRSLKPKPPKAVPLYVFQCEECGAHIEKEIDYFHHKRCHEFSRIALRMHVEQKRAGAELPVFKHPLSPEEDREFLKHRGNALKRKNREDVIDYYPPGYVPDVKEEMLDKLPSVKVYNVRTRVELSKDLKPIPTPAITYVNSDDNENENPGEQQNEVFKDYGSCKNY